MEQEGETISSLKALIKELRESKTNEELLFGRADNYKLYRTLFEGDEIKDFKDIVLDTIEFYLNNRIIENYDLEISCDDSIEVVDTKFVKEYDRLIENLDKEESINSINQDTKLEKINFIYFKLEIPNTTKRIVLLKKFIKPQTTLRQAIRFKMLGNKMERVNEDILYLDNSVSVFEYNSKFYIFDRNHFNSLFKFRDMYCKLIDNNSEEINTSELVDNPQAFIDKCKNNRTLCKKDV